MHPSPVPPIVVDENGDVNVYESVQAACADLEAIDVRAGVYDAFDSRGFHLLIDTSGYEVVNMEVDTQRAADPMDLQYRLQRFITAVGAQRIGLERSAEDQTLTDLLDALIKFFGRPS